MRIVALMTAVGFAGCLSSGSPPTSTVSASTGAAKVGQVVQLDGGKSVDKNKNGLTYEWRFVSAPDGSSPAFSDATSANPTFTPDAEGSYVVGLVVKSGAAASASAQTTITVSGSCFTITGTATGNVGDKVPLVTVASDASCLAIGTTFRWQISSKPAGSTASIDENAVGAEFVADQPGVYDLSYSMKTEGAFSAPKPVTVTVGACTPSIVAKSLLVTSGNYTVLSLNPACNRSLSKVTWSIGSSPSLANTYLYTLANDDKNVVAYAATLGLNNLTAGPVTVIATVTDDHEVTQSISETITFVRPISESSVASFSYALHGGVQAVAYVDGPEGVVVYSEYSPSKNIWSHEFVTPIDSGATAAGVPSRPSLAYLNNQPCVSFITIGGAHALYLVCRSAAGVWPGTTALVGAVSGLTPADSPLTLLANAAGTSLRLLYLETTSTPGLVYLQNCTAASTCGAGTLVSNSATATSGQLVLTKNDAPRVAYLNGTDSNLYIATCATETATCSPATASHVVSDAALANPTGDYSLALSPVDNKSYLAFSDSHQYPRYRSCTGTTACDPIEFVQNANVGGVELVMKDDGTPTLFYADLNNARLKVIQRTSSGWGNSLAESNDYDSNATPRSVQIVQTAGVFQGIVHRGNSFLDLFDPTSVP